MEEITINDDGAAVLRDFGARNRARRARLVVVGDHGTVREEQGVLTGITLATARDGSPSVEIQLGGRSAADVEYSTHRLSHVRRVSTHLAANCCNTLEIEDESGERILLSFESLTDLGQ